jgi:hypothetical protein
MKKLAVFIFVMVSQWTIADDLPNLRTQFKTVELKEFTNMELFILPDAGTQLIFPFKLDNPELEPTLKIQLTNANGFEVPTSAEDLRALVLGQNTISIIGRVNEAAPTAKYLGNLFINIGGYNISIVLKTTFDPNQHVSNITFVQSKEETNHMVENLVKRRTQSLDAEYKRKVESLDSNAKERSLVHIANVVRINPSTTRFKEEGDIFIDKARVSTYIDKLLSYDDKYEVLLFELNNRSDRDIDVSDVDIYSLEKNGESKIAGDFSCDKKLVADSKSLCSFVSAKTTMKTADKLKLVLTTNRGSGEMKW